MFYPVAFLMIVTCPVAYPLGALLDCCLGGDHRRYFGRRELEGLVALHHMPPGRNGLRADPHHCGQLHTTEIRMIQHTLDLGMKTIKEVMTPLGSCFAVAVNSRLTRETIAGMLEKGFSRMPVFVPPEKKNLCGVLCVRTLVLLPPDARVVGDLPLGHLPAIDSDASVWRLLHAFQTCRCKVAAVVSNDHHRRVISHLKEQESVGIPDCWDRPEGKVIGIVTLYDVVSELEITHGEISERVDVHVHVPNDILDCDCEEKAAANLTVEPLRSPYKNRADVVDVAEVENATMEPLRSPFLFPDDDPFKIPEPPSEQEQQQQPKPTRKFVVEAGEAGTAIRVPEYLEHVCGSCKKSFESVSAFQRHKCGECTCPFQIFHSV